MPATCCWPAVLSAWAPASPSSPRWCGSRSRQAMSPSDFLPHGISSETLISLAAGVAAFVTIVALSRSLLPHDPMAARVKAHAKRRAQLRAGLVATPRRSRQSRVGLLRNLVERLKLTQSEESRRAADQLAQAGFRSRDALIVFLSLRLV